MGFPSTHPLHHTPNSLLDFYQPTSCVTNAKGNDVTGVSFNFDLDVKLFTTSFKSEHEANEAKTFLFSKLACVKYN